MEEEVNGEEYVMMVMVMIHFITIALYIFKKNDLKAVYNLH